MSRVANRRLSLNPSPRLARRMGAVALACASVVLASCGGGDRKSYFTPSNIVSFGDENSAIAADTVSNLLDTTVPGVATDLKGLSYTAKAVSVDLNFVCDDDGSSATTVKPCGSNNGQGASFVSSGGPTYHVLGSPLQNFVVKYETGTVGATASLRTTAVDYACDVPSNWVQIIARSYGKGFTDQCPQDKRGGATNHATLGAKTADVIAQINAHRGELGGNTIVTIMVGQNDILEQHAVAMGGNEAGAIATLQGRADAMAAAIKGVIGTGAKVILALTPDLSETPYGAADRDRLGRLVRAYNDRLYISGLGNVSGRSLAGVNPESFTEPGTRSGSYQYNTPLCDASAVRRPDGGTPADDDEKLLFCTSQYYTAGTTSGTAIWADAKRAAPLLHSIIGVTVYNRAREQF